MFGMCQAMPAALRLYGHPQLLAIAAAINGPDFVPYNDAIFVKQPGLGGSVAWHQDGVTHWDSPDWDAGIHGFNFQVQLYPTTAANGLWVVPGTHRTGRVDIKAAGGRQRRQRQAARRRPAAVRRRRRHDRQPPDPARLVRQHLARPPRVDHVRLPSALVGARRAGQAQPQGRRPALGGRRRPTTSSGSSTARPSSPWPSTPAASTVPTRSPTATSPSPASRTTSASATRTSSGSIRDYNTRDLAI